MIEVTCIGNGGIDGWRISVTPKIDEYCVLAYSTVA